MPYIQIDCTDQDISSSRVHWYEPVDDPTDSVWITQQEKGTDVKHTIMFNVAEATQVKDALEQFLSQFKSALSGVDG